MKIKFVTIGSVRKVRRNAAFLLKLIGAVLFFTCFTVGCQRRAAAEFRLEEAGEAEKTQRSADERPETAAESTEQDTTEAFCYVHICGEVVRPGVYKLEAGSRIYEAVALAGGFCPDAGSDFVNQAQPVEDGMKIVIPSAEQVEAGWQPPESAAAPKESDDPRIDLNTATKEQLCTLPGIGETRADGILAYRQEHGAFRSAEEIMQVDGIKEGAFAKLKDLICVRQ